MAKVFRNAFLVFLFLFQAGALWTMMNIFDLSVMQNMLLGMPLGFDAESLWADRQVRVGVWICVAGAAGMGLFFPLWTWRVYVDFVGGDYWIALMREARERAAGAGNVSERAVVYWALRLEADRDGRRPETIRAFLDTFDSPPSPGERALLEVLREDLKDSIDAGREALARGDLEVVWRGRTYDASALMGTAEEAVERARDILFREGS